MNLMNHWTAGYVADIGYTYGYYPELNPMRVRLAFANAGLVCPDIGSACELGFGQGISANLHAAASVVQWHGTDFNPTQAGFAQDLARLAQSHAQLLDDAFVDFARRTDLPDFDYIGIHGIWSWISDENRQVIVDFIQRKLKVGGVLYISYNTLPGWANFAPMRHLLTEHADVISAEGAGIVGRINNALEFAQKLLATNPLYARANPQLADRVKQLQDQNRRYLAHEYFNLDWHPMHFASMAKWLAPARLSFACSASYLDYIEGVNLSPEQQAFLLELPDPGFRESVRDFMVNRQFRKDYWVKGPRRLQMLEQLEALRGVSVVLTQPRADIPLKVQGAVGEVTLTESIANPVLDLLADHAPRTLGELEQALTGAGIHLAQVVQTVLLLAGNGFLSTAQAPELLPQVRPQTDRINQHLMHMARGMGDIPCLASPVTGGGVAVGRFQQMFLQARAQGLQTPGEWAAHAWQLLQAQNQRVMRDGKVLDNDLDNLAELQTQAETFQARHLPVLQALQVA